VREDTRVNLVEIGLTAIATVGTLAVLGLLLFVAYKYFDGWRILEAIAVQLALLVLIYHLYRWFRYPGLLQSKSGQLLFEVSLSILFIYSIPLIAARPCWARQASYGTICLWLNGCSLFWR
jgi:hypothetical protein